MSVPALSLAILHADSQDMKKRASVFRGPFQNGASERSRVGRVERFTRSSGAGSDRFGFRFAAIELAHDIGANAPERLLVGLRFLAFAVSAFVRGANEAALDEHVRTFLDRRCNVLGEPRTEHADAVPLRLRRPLVRIAGGVRRNG